MGRATDSILAVAMAAWTLAFAACGGGPELTVAHAASFRDAAACVDRAPGDPIAWRGHSGGSAVLAQQILRGAPVDVFVSASPDEVERLRQAGRVHGPAIPIAENRLVLLSRTPLSDLAELSGTGIRRVAVPDPALAPAGRYADRALRRAGLLDAVAGRRVPAAHVGHARALLAAGEVDAAFVYATDVGDDGSRWSVLEIPLPGAGPAVTAAALNGPRAEEAARWLERLRSAAARACLEDLGFRRPER